VKYAGKHQNERMMKTSHSITISTLFALALTVTANAADTADLKGTASAVFAGGCFWCIEADFEKLPGVIEAESGYIGGNLENPTYKQVSNGGTGHAEVARVYYDPTKVTYDQLLDYFWRHIDPTVKDRQFCDVGDQYRSAIFYGNDEEKAAALASKSTLEKSGKFTQIHTEIALAGTFYRAEEYHQDYYKKNPIRYKFYRTACRRDSRVAQLWGE
jgi:peptide-methionine (S)-S-oxide reductase